VAEKTSETQSSVLMKEISESGPKEASSVNVEQPSTWQMVLRYRGAILWSAFIGQAGINWGMDVLVCDSSFITSLILTFDSFPTASLLSLRSKKTSDTSLKANI